MSTEENITLLNVSKVIPEGIIGSVKSEAAGKMSEYSVFSVMVVLTILLIAIVSIIVIDRLDQTQKRQEMNRAEIVNRPILEQKSSEILNDNVLNNLFETKQHCVNRNIGNTVPESISALLVAKNSAGNIMSLPKEK